MALIKMYIYNCSLLRVIDGDTIDVSIDLGFDVSIKQRIRLYGIDTPECRTRDLEEKALGLAAKQRLVELLPEAFKIQTIFNKRGKYGRVLGILLVTRDNIDININEQLVEEGHASTYMITEKKL
jgi:micrococcal nuclease